MALIERYTRNTLGRDFAAGDIHGCFDVLKRMLKHIEFDYARDRMFLVGDLVDRGLYSHHVMDWLGHPWLKAVRGNHEQSAIGVAQGRHRLDVYMANGGTWFLTLSQAERQTIAAAFESLPWVIEVETAQGRIGIVHAEPLASWPEMTYLLDHADALSHRLRTELMERCLWSRRRIAHPDKTMRAYRPRATWDDSPVEGIDQVYVGHSVMPELTTLGNLTYLDTGLGKGGSLTCVDLAHPDTPYRL